MRFLFILSFVLLSCTSNHVKPKKQTNWEQIYLNEMKIDKENGDKEAWIFFFQEYMKEVNLNN